jgi:hypothetical protein
MVKVLHIFAHLDALQTTDLLHWGMPFFAQDLALLLMLRLLVDERPGLFAIWRGLEVITIIMA